MPKKIERHYRSGFSELNVNKFAPWEPKVIEKWNAQFLSFKVLIAYKRKEDGHIDYGSTSVIYIFYHTHEGHDLVYINLLNWLHFIRLHSSIFKHMHCILYLVHIHLWCL